MCFSPPVSHTGLHQNSCAGACVLLGWVSQAQQEQYSWTELVILRGFKDGGIAASQCMCQPVLLIFNFFPLPFTLEKSGGSPANFFSALASCSTHTHTQQWHPPSLHPFAMADKAKLRPRQQQCGWAWGHAVVSMQLLQFRIPPHCYLQIPFSLSNLPFVAILVLHDQHEKLRAGFSSPSWRGICNWRQLTPFWGTLYSYSCNCKYHPACTQGSPHLIIAFGPVSACMLWSEQKQKVGLAVSATMVSLNLPCGHH